MQRKLGRYVIEKQVGEGAFAYVYKARDEALGRDVALKVLKPAWLADPQAVHRFKQEARAMARLDRNPHIAVVYDVGEELGQVYLAQLYVDGESLTNRLNRGSLSWLEMLMVLRDIAPALDYAHSQGVVHRDIKPSNILLDKSGIAFLSDFGLVKATEGSESLSASVGGVKGTAAYIPPEIWDGKKATPPTDIYALSCVIAEMLTGQVLFEGSSMMAVMRSHDRGPQFPERWPEDVPDGIEPVLRQGLAANPVERYQSAKELLAALEAITPASVASAANSLRRFREADTTLVLETAAGQRFPVPPGRSTLGRAGDSDILIDTPSVSRQHARLDFDGQRCKIYDEGSANGTVVNGIRVGAEGRILNPGDQIKIGEVFLTVRAIAVEAEDTAPPVVEPPQTAEPEETVVVPLPVESEVGVDTKPRFDRPAAVPAAPRPQPAPPVKATAPATRRRSTATLVVIGLVVGIIVIVALCWGASSLIVSPPTAPARVVTREAVATEAPAAKEATATEAPAAKEATSNSASDSLAGTTLRVSLQSLGSDSPLIDQFEQETGIKVEFSEVPASFSDYQAHILTELAAGSDQIDVYFIDGGWSSLVADYALDLRDQIPQSEIEAHIPAAVQIGVVDGKLVALPWNVFPGLLYYRRDLLEAYGYEPPETWDELEEIAAAVQEGQRADGHNDFWGFVWQGDAYEGLTFNALEWQASHGGGQIINPDGVISVNNPGTIEALQRAAGWVGTISPPEVVHFQEEDARDVWQAGNAVFMRNWSYAYDLGNSTDSPIAGNFDTIVLPRASHGEHVAALGSWQLMVSKYSSNVEAAVLFVRFLAGAEAQKTRALNDSFTPSIVSLYSDAEVLKAKPYMESASDAFFNGVSPPYSVTGQLYDEVNAAYYNQVNRILKGEISAEEGVQELEANLVEMTGLETGSP